MDGYQETVLAECAARLGDAFDGALILVCHKDAGDGGNTRMTSRTRGNDYAAVGMAVTYLDLQKADMTGSKVKEAMDGE